MADDLCQGCITNEYSVDTDSEWERKYIYMKWKR